MLIILIATTVTFSLIAEFFYGYLADRRQHGWVRPELGEDAALMRQLGGLCFNRLNSERQMNDAFKLVSEHGC